MPLSPEYIAGFFDGEGCVNITVAGKSKQATLRIMIANTHKEILEAIQRQFSGHIYRTRASINNPKWKESWQLVLLHQKATDFLEAIEPYIIVKASQVKLGLDFQKFMKSSGRLEGFTNSYGSISHRRTAETLATELQYKIAMNTFNKRGSVSQLMN